MEFVKSYQKANPDPQADVARPQQARDLPPRLKGESTSVQVFKGTTSASKASNGSEISEGDILRTNTRSLQYSRR